MGLNPGKIKHCTGYLTAQNWRKNCLNGWKIYPKNWCPKIWVSRDEYRKRYNLNAAYDKKQVWWIQKLGQRGRDVQSWNDEIRWCKVNWSFKR